MAGTGRREEAAGASMARRLDAFADFSWRDDARVPDFADAQLLIVFDGVCVLCSGFAGFVARRDRQRRFRFTAAQSKLGQGLMQHFGLDSVNFETNLLLENGRGYGKLAAFGRIMAGLGGPWRGLAVCGLARGRLGDWAYDRIATNRYRLFGRRETCVRADESWRDRVIDDIE